MVGVELPDQVVEDPRGVPHDDLVLHDVGHRVLQPLLVAEHLLQHLVLHQQPSVQGAGESAGASKEG